MALHPSVIYLRGKQSFPELTPVEAAALTEIRAHGWQGNLPDNLVLTNLKIFSAISCHHLDLIGTVFPAAEEFTICECAVTALPVDTIQLKKLIIKNCWLFASMPDRLSGTIQEIEVENCPLTKISAGLIGLKKAIIKGCPITELPPLFSGLEYLDVSGTKISHFRRGTIPNSVHTLISDDCQNLLALSEEEGDALPNELRILQMRNCPERTALNVPLPDSTVILDFSNNPKLQALPSLTENSRLRELFVPHCESLQLPHNLKDRPLRRINFSHNPWLVDAGDYLADTLWEAIFFGCQNLKTFPTSGLPPYLKLLDIRRTGLNMEDPASEKDILLHFSPSLERLFITGPGTLHISYLGLTVTVEPANKQHPDPAV